MFRIKICGVTTVDDARMVADAGADALGLNFYNASKRCVDVAIAREITRAVGQRLLRVGVFVNHSVEEIRQIAAEVDLAAVQLHGDEPPEMVAQLAGLPVILARRFAGDAGEIVRDIDRCRAAGGEPAAVLVDAAVAGHYGGAGETLPWEKLAGSAGLLGGAPLLLAGGLRPKNLAEAIRTVGPYGVDVASGVESTPGRKDRELCSRFVQVARENGLAG